MRDGRTAGPASGRRPGVRGAAERPCQAGGVCLVRGDTDAEAAGRGLAFTSTEIPSFGGLALYFLINLGN